MTIIAGFKSYEGIVLCADSRETIQPAKRNVPKLRFEPCASEYKEENFSNLAVAFCGAGDGPFIDKLVEESWKACQGSRNLDAGCEAIESSIKEQYREFGQIFQQGLCPEAQLIYGVKMDGQSRLFSAWGPIVNEKRGHDSGGIGHYIVDFLAGRMYRSLLNVYECAILAAYVLFQAKENVEGCGGDSQIAVLRNNGASGTVDWKRVEVMTELLKFVDHGASELLLHSADLAIGETDLRQKFNLALDLLRTQRENAADEMRKWESVVGILGGSKPKDLLGLPLPPEGERKGAGR